MMNYKESNIIFYKPINQKGNNYWYDHLKQVNTMIGIKDMRNEDCGGQKVLTTKLTGFDLILFLIQLIFRGGMHGQP